MLIGVPFILVYFCKVSCVNIIVAFVDFIKCKMIKKKKIIFRKHDIL